MRGLALLALAATAHAEPLRLRADALAATASPAGLLVLEAEGKGAEAVVWMAGTDDDRDGDVLVIAVRTRAGLADVRAGRFVSTVGALRAAHVDGAALRVRLPYRLDVETVAGIPVMPGLDTDRGWDWLVGGRLSRRIGDAGSLGIAYAQRRDAGMLANEEVGIDGGFAFTQRADAGARVAYDMASFGIAEIALTTSYRRKAVRGELYAIHREASHLLPATSLFSVIGDVPSQRAGGALTWKAAPRLDLIADAGARRIDDDLGLELAGRARLRLDDSGASLLGAEVRRSGVADDAWNGVRGTARIALGRGFVASSELELVIPDVDRGRGGMWPWALAALAWENREWQAAVAAEASASPEHTRRFDVLAQLARRWGAK